MKNSARARGRALALGADPTAEGIHNSARELMPEIAARVEEIAVLRRLPLDLVAKLRAAGVFRMAMPRSRGGPQMTPRRQLELIELLSIADPSVGWCVKSGAESGFLSAFLDEPAASELYPGLDHITASDLAPNGVARPVPGGYLVSGRWRFVSGCTHAEVIAVRCRIDAGSNCAKSGATAGPCETRMVMAAMGSWQILDTWYTTGLAGTGSHDVTAHELFVPDRHTFEMREPASEEREPLCRCNAMTRALLQGVPLGLARRAIDVLAELGRVTPADAPARSGRARSIESLRAELARAEALLGAARAYTYDVLDTAWAHLERHGFLTLQLRTALQLTRMHAFQVSREVAQRMHDAAGATAVYNDSPLGRLLRDAITMSQHAVSQDESFANAGAALLR